MYVSVVDAAGAEMLTDWPVPSRAVAECLRVMKVKLKRLKRWHNVPGKVMHLLGPGDRWVNPFGSTSDWHNGMSFRCVWLPSRSEWTRHASKMAYGLYRELHKGDVLIAKHHFKDCIRSPIFIDAEGAKSIDVVAFSDRGRKGMPISCMPELWANNTSCRAWFTPDATADEWNPRRSERRFFPMHMQWPTCVWIKGATKFVTIPSMLLGLKMYPEP
jgi:hypothetical protein